MRLLHVIAFASSKPSIDFAPLRLDLAFLVVGMVVVFPSSIIQSQLDQPEEIILGHDFGEQVSRVLKVVTCAFAYFLDVLRWGLPSSVWE